MADPTTTGSKGFGLVCWVLIGLARQEEGAGEEGRSKRHRGTRVTKVTKGCRGLPRVTESGLPRLRIEGRVRGEDKFRINDHKCKVKISKV